MSAIDLSIIPDKCPRCGNTGYWDQETELVEGWDAPSEVRIWFVCQTGVTAQDCMLNHAAAHHGHESQADEVCGYETEKIVYSPTSTIAASDPCPEKPSSVSTA
jgi:hypothetical protein